MTIYNNIFGDKETLSNRKYQGKMEKLRTVIQEADAVLIGAGAGLSTSAGFVYTGERFTKYFSDFAAKYGFKDMYSGGFYPFDSLEEYWAYWSRYIYINRYMDAPKPVYEDSLKLVQGKDYFVLTTNVDHCFQKAGFDKHRLFYTQGDYGLLQCSKPCHHDTYDNEEIVKKMVEEQGYKIAEDGTLVLPENSISGSASNRSLEDSSNVFSTGSVKMKVPSQLVPHCPKCGAPMTMNLRADSTFVEDDGWHKAAFRYDDFVRRHKGMRMVFLELGVGYNTPGIVKYPFWQMTAENPSAVYCCINYRDAACPLELQNQAICIEGDIGEVLSLL